MARRLWIHLAALAAAVVLAVVSASVFGQNAAPAAGGNAALPQLDIEAILNTSDSLSFSASRQDDETIVEPDKGQGFVRSIMDTPFGETKFADVMFRHRGILYLWFAAGIAGMVLLYRRASRGTTELPVTELATSTGHSLPVVGEAHPVGRMSMRLSQRAAIVAILAHVMLFGAWMVGRNLPAPAPPKRVVRFVTISELAAPPSISGNEAPPPVNIAQNIVQPTIGLPEPVPDWQAPDVNLATQEEMASFQSTDLSGLGEGDGIVVVQGGENTGPSAGQGTFKEVDTGEVPVLLNMPRPVYPDIARTAEVEGIVMLDILVGEDGRVKEVKVMKGHPMLNDAAVAAARGATFKPAMQQKHPVPVWVEFPMRFTLY